jgi:hypothetical protein
LAIALLLSAWAQVGVGNNSAPMPVASSAIPPAQVGVHYKVALQASGGTLPYTWRVVAGALPSGIALDSATGVLSGTPGAVTAAATTVIVKVTDSSSPARSNNISLAIAVAPPAPRIPTAALSGDAIGQPVTAGASASLSLPVSDAGSGSSAPHRAASNLPLEIAIPSTVPATLTITTTALPPAQVGTPYSFKLTATGGTAPYTWQYTAGPGIPGMSIASNGQISGTPQAPLDASLTFKVTDSGSPAQSASIKLTAIITPATLRITTTGLPAGRAGAPYSATLSATGGTTPYSWTLTAGTLPAGLSFASNGTLSGTPTAAVTSSLTFKVTDSGNPKQSSTATLAVTIASAKLTITTTSLPNGQVNSPYTVSLAATGGTTPYSWMLTAGTLPAGLSFASNGTLSGKPTATVSSTPLTFKVTDASNPTQTSSATLPLTITAAGNITVSVSPARAGLAVGQKLSVVATTNDTAGVKWSISPSGGSFSATTTLSGVSTTLTAPAAAGVYTVTATSVTSSSTSASFTLGVTDLAGVYTYHSDVARDGANTHEYALTRADVATATFGKLFSCTVDGAIYAEPLWVAQLSVGGSVHNVVFVATQHDSLFAFDADTSPCQLLWQVSLIDTAHGGTGGEVAVPSGTSGNLVGYGDGDITPEVGVTGTPVFDPVNNILYVVSKSMNAAGSSFYQRLHAIDPPSGNEKSGSPLPISATFPGTHDGGSSDTFSARQQNQRDGLTLANGNVYIAWSSHEDRTPYYGWVVAYSYNGSEFSQKGVFNDTPNAGQGGIWMAGGAPSVDSNGNLYLVTGNGTFDATNTSGFKNDYGDSFLQMSPSLGVNSYFTPSDQASDAANDVDQGSGGAALVVNLSSGSPQHLIIGGGKDGTIYVLDGDSMGGLGDSNSRQHFPLGKPIFATGAFWNNTYYIAGTGGPLAAYAFNPSTELFSTSYSSSSSHAFGWPGTTPSVSAGGTSNGIVWALDTSQYCTKQSPGCGPAVLHAFNATNLSELWNSSMVAGDAAGNAVKFTVPTVANGKVYVGTRGNNTGGAYGSTSVSGELDVYALKSH